MASSSKMRLMAYEDSPVLILTLLLLLVDLMVGYYDDSLLSWLLDQVIDMIEISCVAITTLLFVYVLEILD